MRIHLKDLKFFAYHGLYAFEKEQGNNFVVNVVLECDMHQEPINKISQTVNYELIFDIVYKRMQQPTELLETLVAEMTDNLFVMFSQIVSVNISIEKLNPPIPNLTGSVVVSLERIRN